MELMARILFLIRLAKIPRRLSQSFGEILGGFNKTGSQEKTHLPPHWEAMVF